MSLAVAATVFALVLPAELPDKTLVATLVLSTRYRPGPVWIGVAAAFLVQSFVAVALGGLLVLLPKEVVRGVVAVLFALGAYLVLRDTDPDDDLDAEEERESERLGPPGRDKPFWTIVAASFGVLFVAEWGDVSQIATATFQARYHDPVAVFLGSWAALAGVAAIAVWAGQAALRHVPLRAIRIGAGGLFILFAVVSAVEAVRAAVSH